MHGTLFLGFTVSAASVAILKLRYFNKAALNSTIADVVCYQGRHALRHQTIAPQNGVQTMHA